MLELFITDAFAGLAAAAPADGAPVWVQSLPNAGVVTLLARKGAAQDFAREVRSRIGVELPEGPRAVAAGELTIVGTGPGAWLVTHWRRPALAADLRPLGAFASVVDQSGGFALLRIGGAGAADLLSRGVFLDLDESVFPPGAAAGVNLVQAAVVLWRIADDQFGLAVPRSYASTVSHWLGGLAAEFPMAVRAPFPTT